MTSITSVAEAFFEACEAGRGWNVCSAYCTPDATFRAQAEPLLEVKTLQQYTDWMKGGDDDTSWLYGYDAWNAPLEPDVEASAV